MAVLIVGGIFLSTRKGGERGVMKGIERLPDETSNPVPPEPTVPITLEEAKAEAESAEMTETYTSKKYPFSFKYPKGFSVTVLPFDEENNADTLMINGAGMKTSIQIYISPFDEPTNVITEELIRRDLPDMPIANPREVVLGSAGKGIAFESGDSGIKTREVWFAYKKKLYQLTTYLEADLMLQKILGTFVLK